MSFLNREWSWKEFREELIFKSVVKVTPREGDCAGAEPRGGLKLVGYQEVLLSGDVFVWEMGSVHSLEKERAGKENFPWMEGYMNLLQKFLLRV